MFADIGEDDAENAMADELLNYVVAVLEAECGLTQAELQAVAPDPMGYRTQRYAMRR